MKQELKNFYKGKKVLVTGATGFKGAWLCLWLNLLGAKVIGIGFNPNKNKNLFYSVSCYQASCGFYLVMPEYLYFQYLNKLKIRPI